MLLALSYMYLKFNMNMGESIQDCFLIQGFEADFKWKENPLDGFFLQVFHIFSGYFLGLCMTD